MKKFRLLSGLIACTLLSSFLSIAPKAVEAKAPIKQDTELVLVVDKSGSMYSLANDTIGSFNSVIDEQKNSDKQGEVYVTTVMFNSTSNTVHDRKDIKNVEHITKKEYNPGGCTALFDAVGSTITELSSKKEVDKNKVVFVVITDGYENASREFSKDQVKRLIDEKKKLGWNFIFLGANIDSSSESGKLGIDKNCARDFVASGMGVKEAFIRVSTAINQVRDGRKIDLDENVEKKDNNEENKKNDQKNDNKRVKIDNIKIHNIKVAKRK